MPEEIKVLQKNIFFVIIIFMNRIRGLKQSNVLKPGCLSFYYQFNVLKVHVQHIDCIYVFYVDLRVNSAYFSVQQ